QMYDQNTSPWALLEGAIAVYTVTSQMGMEAIFAGHRPQVFGQPFYAGWGLSDDRAAAPARRARNVTKTQLFAAAYLLAPQWFSPHIGALCSFEQAVDVLQADLRAQREDAAGYAALGMRVWKRGRLQAVFGRQKPLIFINNRTRAQGLRLMVWGAGTDAAAAIPDTNVVHVEDGLLRSRGLGAALTPPISLIADDVGIYYNPAQPSGFEALMMQPLPPYARARAAVFLDGLISARLSKYNLPSESQLTLPPSAQNRRRILVPGQVADDASLRFGAQGGFGADTGADTGAYLGQNGAVPSNLDLLRAARARHPDAFIIYKPHPDVEAGLRAGAVPAQMVAALADMQAVGADPIAAIEAVDEVFTLTSTLGFEALLRGRAVTCLGAPFYAGWGLTRDVGPIPQRRLRGPDGGLLPRPT
ncbi:MAG: capsular polysaccharide biosynthesis protein, partial [Cypionkella sp.]